MHSVLRQMAHPFREGWALARKFTNVEVHEKAADLRTVGLGEVGEIGGGVITDVGLVLVIQVDPKLLIIVGAGLVLRNELPLLEAVLICDTPRVTQ